MKAEEYVPVETKGYRLISKTMNISANSTKNYHTRKVFNWLILFNFKTPVFECYPLILQPLEADKRPINHT